MKKNLRRLAATVAVFSVVGGVGAATASATQAPAASSHQVAASGSHTVKSFKSTDEWPV